MKAKKIYIFFFINTNFFIEWVSFNDYFNLLKKGKVN